MPRPNSALSSNSEFDHAGPAAVAIHRVRRGGQIAAVDGRAASGIRDHRPIAEQLRQQLDVGRFAATGAGARKLEQRLQQLHVFDVVSGQVLRSNSGRPRKKSQLRRSCSRNRRLRRHVDGFLLRFALALGRAHLHAQAATGAILRAPPAAGSSAARDPSSGRRWIESRRVRRLVMRDRTPSRESPRAGKPSRTCRTGCRSLPPTPESPARDCVSPISTSRWDRCRRRASR